MARPECFNDGSTSYADGQWQLASGAQPPYRITSKFWASIGSKMNSNMPQHYGKCDDPPSKQAPPPPPRPVYEWVPNACSLRRLEASSACDVLGGKQIVVVGDSTVLQTFLSLVLMLGGRFGRDVKNGMVIADLTASACDGTTRLSFVRSDLLLWTEMVSDYHTVRQCDAFSILHPFVQRASRDADVVLLGMGHHLPRSLMLAEKWTKLPPPEAARRARIEFVARNLNHTLHSLIARRAVWGHTDPASVVLLGTSTPVRGCARFDSPLSLEGAIAAAAAGSGNDGDVTSNELRWTQYARQNQHASWLARQYGASFLDVALPSAMRPDGAMGRFWPAHVRQRLDCVHYCLPGVVDTWSTLFVNLLASSRLQRALRASPPPPPVDANGALSVAPRRAPRRRMASMRGRRFFDANETLWHTERGFAERFEGCRKGGLPAQVARKEGGPVLCEAQLQLQPWWPFVCWDGAERRAQLASDHATKWVPWSPPESFD